MKLIGDVKSRYNIQAPLIGFVPWAVVHHRKKLEEAGGKDRKFPVLYKRLPPTVDSVSLNPHHTHFVLVDGGEANEPAWGAGLGVRQSSKATRSFGIPLPSRSEPSTADDTAPIRVPTLHLR